MAVKTDGRGQRRILVVEDNAVNREVALGFLTRLGYPADSADDGAQAVQAALRHPYALILMDVQMPVLDGLEATRCIRAWRTHSPPIIVAMTAHSSASDRDECLEAGMDDYLSKPLRLGRLEAVLAQWLDEAEPAVPPPEPALRAPERLDEELLRELHDALADQALSLVEGYLLDAKKRVASLAGLARRGEWPALRREAHALRGSSANVGARQLSALCRVLEALTLSENLGHALPVIQAVERCHEEDAAALLKWLQARR